MFATLSPHFFSEEQWLDAQVWAPGGLASGLGFYTYLLNDKLISKAQFIIYQTEHDLNFRITMGLP